LLAPAFPSPPFTASSFATPFVGNAVISSTITIHRNCTTGSFFHTTAMALGPTYWLIGIGRAAVAIAVIAIATAIPATVITVPALALLSPMPAVIVAHRVTVTVIIEHIIAVARVPVAVIPAAAKADIVKAVAAIAGIIAIPRRIRVAIIIAIIIVAQPKPRIIDAAG
jgi:hypothetical protein